MNRTIILTTDGSHSISIPDSNITYHSTHGAIQESMHVFIDAGMRALIQKISCKEIGILEMGFGTGLNALLTLIEAEKERIPVYYETIELYPLEETEYSCLNYCEQLDRPDLVSAFHQLHQAAWGENIAISPWFLFKKNRCSLSQFISHQLFDLIYFDAFAPEVQPELWTADVFKQLYACMKPGAVLTTYCSKSIVRKAMATAGLLVTKIPGPPHKREIVRAVKQ